MASGPLRTNQPPTRIISHHSLHHQPPPPPPSAIATSFLSPLPTISLYDMRSRVLKPYPCCRLRTPPRLTTAATTMISSTTIYRCRLFVRSVVQPSATLRVIKRLSIPCLSTNQGPTTLLSSLFEECAQFKPIYRISSTKNPYRSFTSVISSRGLPSVRVLHLSVDTREVCDVEGFYEQRLVDRSGEEQTCTQEIELESSSHEDCKERERRRKIGLANRGRVPWNKGRKHSDETRERIRQRTREALRDPKVKKKMSECPRAHSNQTKARIRSSLRRLWGERQKWRRSLEEFFQFWAESIANAAKKGGVDQEELDWDSYDKIKKEIVLEQLQWAADKAKAKEMAQIRAQRKEKAKKLAIIAKKRKKKEQREQKGKLRGEVIRETTKKSTEEREEFAVAPELKLKERLTKIHKKKSINSQFTNKDHRAWEELDLEFVRKEQRPKELSLADQILAAKEKRAELLARKDLRNSLFTYPSSERSVE